MEHAEVPDITLINEWSPVLTVGILIMPRGGVMGRGEGGRRW